MLGNVHVGDLAVGHTAAQNGNTSLEDAYKEGNPWQRLMYCRLVQRHSGLPGIEVLQSGHTTNEG